VVRSRPCYWWCWGWHDKEKARDHAEGAGRRRRKRRAPVSHRIGRPGQSPETPLGMCGHLRAVIRSDNDLLRGPPSPAAFCLSRQLHDWQRYNGLRKRRPPGPWAPTLRHVCDRARSSPAIRDWWKGLWASPLLCIACPGRIHLRAGCLIGRRRTDYSAAAAGHAGGKGPIPIRVSQVVASGDEDRK
jgi:hypothetical protein